MKNLLTIITLLLFAFLMTNSLLAETPFPHVADVAAVKGRLTVKHANIPNWLDGYEKMPNYLQDTLKTDPDSVADIEFTIGGHLGINKNTTIEITGPRDVKDVTQRSFMKKIIIKSGEVWAKITKQEEKLEFQTEGGVIAIKGTEFVVEEHPDTKETVVSVLDGKIGIQRTEGETVYSAGDKVTISWAAVPVVKHYKPEELRKENENKYRDLQTLSTFASYLSYGGVYVPSEAYWAVSFMADPNQAAISYAESTVNSYVPGPFGISIGGGGNKKKEPDFPYELNPNQTPVDSFTPAFSWKKMEKAVNYWFFISEKEDMKGNNDLLWNKKVSTTTVSYPADARPLKPGQTYYWRLIALDNKDKAIGKASQTSFTVSPGLQRQYTLTPQYPQGTVSPGEEALTFCWTKDPCLSKFEIKVSESSDLCSPIVSDRTDFSYYTVSESQKSMFKKGKTYYWQVQGLDESGSPAGNPSNSVQFTITGE